MSMQASSVTDADRLIHGDADLASTEDWSPAAVKLLQGVVYHDDHGRIWASILANVSMLSDYFAKIGLRLVVDETDGMAYLRQADDDDLEGGQQPIPRLFRKSPLTFESTLLCVLIRDFLRQFEEEDYRNQRCVVSQQDLLELWKAFFPQINDEVKLNRSLGATLRKLEDLRFVRPFESEMPSWEIRRIIKARLPLSDLEALRVSLVQAIEKQAVENCEQLEDASAMPLFDEPAKHHD